MLDWTKYPNFTADEFDCSHTGDNEMQAEFMDKLQALRTEYGKPMVITSGYRSPEHPAERDKPIKGAHTMGKACDVFVSGEDAWLLVVLAHKHGFTGCGVKQKGSSRFIHLDTATIADGLPRPAFYSY